MALPQDITLKTMKAVDCSLQTLAFRRPEMTTNLRGGKRRRHAPRKLNHDQAREIMALIAQGVQGKVIADRYKVGRRTLYAAIARMDEEVTVKPTGWQPIETAPKDGTDFDVWTKFGRIADCMFAMPTYDRKIGIIWKTGYDCAGPIYELVTEPTHWMPLPPPPTA